MLYFREVSFHSLWNRIHILLGLGWIFCWNLLDVFDLRCHLSLRSLYIFFTDNLSIIQKWVGEITCNFMFELICAFSFTSVFFMKLGIATFGVYMFSVIIFSWLVDPLIKMMRLPLLHWLVFVWSLFVRYQDDNTYFLPNPVWLEDSFHPFTLRWCLSLKLRWVSYRKILSLKLSWVSF